jgi:hypothetical protein
MGQLMSQHVNREESKKAINYIFPPVSYLGDKVLDSAMQVDENYSREIEGLLKKFTSSAYPLGSN